MSSRRRGYHLYLLAVVIPFTMLIGSCAQKTVSSYDLPESQTTILYLTSNKENEGSAKIISELAHEYEQLHPNVTFKFENLPERDLSPRVQLLAASNDLPVLFSYQSGKPLKDLILSNAVLDIEDVFPKLGLKDALNPAAVDLLKSYAGGEGLYALPLEMNIEGFWYNKSLFRQYGLQEPKTWDDLLAIADLLDKKGVQPFSVAGKEKWPITRLINAYAIRMYGADVMDRVEKKEIALTSPGFVEATRTVQDMGLRGYFGARVNEVDMAASVDLFLQGKAAMFYMGSWQLRSFNDKKLNQIGADNIGFFSIPIVRGGAGSIDEYPVNAGLTTSFSKEAYSPEVSEWMKFVFERYGERAMSELGMVTGFHIDSMPADLPPLTKMVQEKISQVKRGALWFEARFDTEAQLMAWDNAQLLVTNKDYTPLAYLEELQHEIDQGQ